MADAPAQFVACGDSGLAIDFGERIDRDISARVLSLQARVKQAALPGVVEMVPTFRSLLLHLDPDSCDIDGLKTALAPMLKSLDAAPQPGRNWEIPVCYDPAMAPDLDYIAIQSGLTPAQVVEAHSSVVYYVYMVGFLPGFVYLGDVPDEIALPRRDDPRHKVPRGSISIATTLTSIYTVESPGGWHLIGRTPVGFFDPERIPPALLRPGDTVCLKPVSADEYAVIDEACLAGRYELRPVETA